MSHRTVREPTDEELVELRRMKRQEVGRVSVRAHIILLSTRGYSASEIAKIHDVTGPMVYKWFDRFDEEGPSGLYDRERDGRPEKITKEVEEEIERLLEGNPTEEGNNATRWTTDRIAEHLERELDVDVHPETVRDALSRLEYSWTRPRRELRPTDPEAYQKRLTAIVEAVAEADEETSVHLPIRRSGRALCLQVDNTAGLPPQGQVVLGYDVQRPRSQREPLSSRRGRPGRAFFACSWDDLTDEE